MKIEEIDRIPRLTSLLNIKTSFQKIAIKFDYLSKNQSYSPSPFHSMKMPNVEKQHVLLVLSFLAVEKLHFEECVMENNITCKTSVKYVKAMTFCSN